MQEVRIESPGKWILLGEHSVIRAHPALVFPLESRKLSLSFLGGTSWNQLLDPSWRKPFALASARLNAYLKEEGNFESGNFFCLPGGALKINCDIPLGAGLGSSAAFSIAIVRLAIRLGLLEEKFFFPASLAIEDGFHGKSSGMDIVAALSKTPLYYLRGQEPETLRLAWKPKIFLSDSGERSSTAVCVAKVEGLRATSPEKFLHLDQSMAAAVNEAFKALSRDANDSFDRLAQAINQGHEIFRAWGLTTKNVDDKIAFLLAQGAVAAKPTGSGGGGFILSLWREDPPFHIFSDTNAPLISAFE